MLNTLAYGSKGAASRVLAQIGTAVGSLKEIENAYAGNLGALRFGAIFREDGTVTYHANYAGCENETGISSADPNDLLKQLQVS